MNEALLIMVMFTEEQAECVVEKMESNLPLDFYMAQLRVECHVFFFVCLFLFRMAIKKIDMSSLSSLNDFIPYATKHLALMARLSLNSDFGASSAQIMLTYNFYYLLNM